MVFFQTKSNGRSAAGAYSGYGKNLRGRRYNSAYYSTAGAVYDMQPGNDAYKRVLLGNEREGAVIVLELVPVTLREANAFVERYHRHHKPVVGHKFSIAASDGKKIVGVAIVGRPVSRYLDNGLTLEVNRLCTDGTRNACSFLYSAAWRAARNLGYKKLITYILESENGSSLKAAGWKCIGECGGLRWNGRSRPEVDLYPAQLKLRFEIENEVENGNK